MTIDNGPSDQFQRHRSGVGLVADVLMRYADHHDRPFAGADDVEDLPEPIPGFRAPGARTALLDDRDDGCRTAGA